MTALAPTPGTHSHRKLGAGAFSTEPSSQPAEAKVAPAAPFLVPDLSGFHELRIWAESFEDAQRARIACENRMLRGGVPADLFAGQIEALRNAEHVIALAMRRSYRRVAPPGVIVWQKTTFGIGEHLLARLLGTLGHPRIATPFHWEGEGAARELVADPPFERSVRQLWSYCGHGDAARKKRKGMTAEEAFGLGSPRCKMLVHLLAEATIKCRVEPNHGAMTIHPSADSTTSPPHSTHQASAVPRSDGEDSSADQPRAMPTAKSISADRRYRVTYDQARDQYQDREDWTLGHQHNAALRLVGKHILRDLWSVA